MVGRGEREEANVIGAAADDTSAAFPGVRAELGHQSQSEKKGVAAGGHGKRWD